jgi:hypothetical protein
LAAKAHVGTDICSGLDIKIDVDGSSVTGHIVSSRVLGLAGTEGKVAVEPAVIHTVLKALAGHDSVTNFDTLLNSLGLVRGSNVTTHNTLEGVELQRAKRTAKGFRIMGEKWEGRVGE